MIRCLIVDDEQHALDILIHYIEQTPQLEMVAATTNPIEALQLVATQPVDLVLLDIQMPELSGMDFIRSINGKCKVILTTAYSEFALDGYELDVVDYLLKPIRLPRFLTAIQKATTAIAASRQAGGTTTPDDDYIFVKTETKGKLLKISLTDIDYIEGMKNYVAIYTGNKKTLVYTSLKEMEERLPARRFLRIHKSFIVAIDRITGIEGNKVMLKGIHAEIITGDNYKAELMKIVRDKMI
ncbi:LytR/AlgR family response regulator transcription factor [Paraflavitalea pollutisoli]|uniref:LytR/AlgR family response regulator transcription factor n=1 Tax=Paraflavitalea pollutisoli TaxID=3034143 RepID=UPI0023ED72A1|nr:LytTR family DNA-binding domain-containing protein [Paraflavitalea sp. H1-2-19X]